jgi:hypothetical protein
VREQYIKAETYDSVKPGCERQRERKKKEKTRLGPIIIFEGIFQ